MVLANLCLSVWTAATAGSQFATSPAQSSALFPDTDDKDLASEDLDDLDSFEPEDSFLTPKIFGLRNVPGSSAYSPVHTVRFKSLSYEPPSPPPRT